MFSGEIINKKKKEEVTNKHIETLCNAEKSLIGQKKCSKNNNYYFLILFTENYVYIKPPLQSVEDCKNYINPVFRILHRRVFTSLWIQPWSNFKTR